MAMSVKLSLFGLVLLWVTSTIHGIRASGIGNQSPTRCGGLIESNVGSLTYNDNELELSSASEFEEGSEAHPCVWLLQLHSTYNMSITPDFVLGDTSASVFTLEQTPSGGASAFFDPVHIFNKSTIGTTVTTLSSTAIVVLFPSRSPRHIVFSWRGIRSGGASIHSTARARSSVNYLDSNTGTLQLDGIGLAKMGLVINPSTGNKIELDLSVINHEDDCANLSSSLFELDATGCLRQVVSTCGRAVWVSSLKTPAIIFIVNKNVEQSERVKINWKSLEQESNHLSSPSPPPFVSCGGSVNGNHGQLEYEDVEDRTGSGTCIWTLRLETTTGFQLTLLAANDGTMISAFTNKETDSVVTATRLIHVFRSSSISKPVDTEGELVVLILHSNSANEDKARRFSLKWNGLQPSTLASLQSTTYLDSNSGTLTENDAELNWLAFVLNPPNVWHMNLDMRLAGSPPESCTNMEFSLFETNVDGHLLEVSRTCGRPLTVHNVAPPLIAFVMKSTAAQSEALTLSWTSPRPSQSQDSDNQINLPETDDMQIPVTSQSCGGVLLGAQGLISYKHTSPYLPNERCVWSIRSHTYERIRFQMTSDGFYKGAPGLDFVALSSVSISGWMANPNISTGAVINGGDHEPIILEGPMAFVIFYTSQGGRAGFQLSFEGLGARRPPNYSLNHFSYNSTLNSQGCFQYPEFGADYKNNELVSFVFAESPLNSQKSIKLEIVYLDMEYQSQCEYDSLSIYTMNSRGTLDKRGNSLCARNSTVVHHYDGGADGVIILIFKTDATVVKRGFRGSYAYV